jgi:hypothetical protein
MFARRTPSALTGSVLAAALSVAPVLVPAAAVAAVFAPSIARADESQTADCKVHAVLASKEGEGGIPKNLEFLASELRSDQFAAYRTFRLLDQRGLSIDRDTVKEARLDSGHRVGLKLLGGEIERPKVHVTVHRKDDDKSLVSADYTIASSGFLLLAGFKHAEGMVIMAIQCKAK